MGAIIHGNMKYEILTTTIFIYNDVTNFNEILTQWSHTDFPLVADVHLQPVKSQGL